MLTDNAVYAAKRLTVGVREIVNDCENPEWVYESSVYNGATVAVGGRLTVSYDASNGVILDVAWRTDWARR